MKKRVQPTDVHIGSKIRARRMHLNRSQKWLAEQLGLTFQQVQKYEKGTNRVGGSRMQQIAAALDVSPAYFFEGAPNAKTGNVSDVDLALRVFTTSRGGIEIVKAWPKLSDSFRLAFSRLVEAAAAGA